MFQQTLLIAFTNVFEGLREIDTNDVLEFIALIDSWDDMWSANNGIWREVWEVASDHLFASPIIFDFHCLSCLELELPNVSLLDGTRKVSKVTCSKHKVQDGIKAILYLPFKVSVGHWTAKGRKYANRRKQKAYIKKEVHQQQLQYRPLSPHVYKMQLNAGKYQYLIYQQEPFFKQTNLKMMK